MKYGILRYPHPNKRYFESSKVLLECEFNIMIVALSKDVKTLGYKTIGGVELFVFEAEEMTEALKTGLNRISANFILFEVDGDALKPLNEDRTTYFKDDISSILKYSGKTNEAFTGMMINVGIFSSNFKREFQKPLNIFDPMCGRGTTLYQGLIMGHNVAGIEIQKRDFAEINKFLKRYLTFHKYKHNESHQSIVMGGVKKGMKYTIETADTAEHYKANDIRKIQFCNGNTLDSNDFYKKDSFHVIVTDIPYGVQHSGTSQEKPVQMAGLLKKAAAAWRVVLKTGGTVVISYNAFTLSKDTLKEIFEEAGYEVFTEGAYGKFEHWVEQAVNRDVFVAKKARK